MTQEIDFVVTWVDDTDENWQQERKMYQSQQTADDCRERYRDWDLLRYWFRGVEKYAPWVRKIHFVTCGHLPKWINTQHPKLHVVRHEDYIPQEYLPTFNSNVLEIYLHKIEGLAENFVYFNDDMYLIKDIKPELFFRNGKPCDMLAFQPVVANPRNPVMSHLYLNNALVLAKHFKKREGVRKNIGQYFKIGYPPLYFFYNMLELAFPLYTAFYTVHGPSAFCKKTFQEVWVKEEPALKKMSQNRFRSETDLTPYLFREWQKLSGDFYPKNMKKESRYFEIGKDLEKQVRTIEKQKSRMICINDVHEKCDFATVQKELQGAFEKILPEKSAFEKE